MNLLAEEFEYLDPTPDIWSLFLEYDALFFDSQLQGCEIKWSPRMTLCAGLCSFQPASGFCSIRLSQPLLKLRPRSDLVNTLLHEMIHAFLFLHSPVRDHEDHGPQFQFHMHRINKLAQTQITVYHTFHDEVDTYRVHWWKCNGPCQGRPPYFGLVKRAMNRPPGPRDTWWTKHEQECGGAYTKVKEPPPKPKKTKVLKLEAAVAKKAKTVQPDQRAQPSIATFFKAPLLEKFAKQENAAPKAPAASLPQSWIVIPTSPKPSTAKKHPSDVVDLTWSDSD